MSERPSQGAQAAPPVPHAIVEGDVHIEPLQHPVAHVVASHPEHTPDVQLDDPGHDAHGAPPTPQAAAVVPGRHVTPSQQPAHEVPSQTHAPPTQRWPDPQGALVPQRHAPPASQRSAVVVLQATQAAPPAPHAASEGVVQIAPEQQPLGHVVASHTHPPSTHSWPAAQAGPVPQRHSPSAHESAIAESQATHAAPPAPHVVLELARHVLPSQQPLGHEVASHTHAPPAQRWPLPHGGPDPHVHAPAVHPSARDGSHATHAPPAVPHVARLGALHVVPEQHPVVQPAAQVSQTPAVQPPPPQVWHEPPPVPH